MLLQASEEDLTQEPVIAETNVPKQIYPPPLAPLVGILNPRRSKTSGRNVYSTPVAILVSQPSPWNVHLELAYGPPEYRFLDVAP